MPIFFLGHASPIFLSEIGKGSSGKGHGFSSSLRGHDEEQHLYWEVSLGERQSHDPSLFGELQPGRDFVKWNPPFSSTVDCAEGGQEWEKEATNIETFGYCYL